MCEFSPSGDMIPTYDFRTVRFLRFKDNYDYFVAAFEILIALFTVWYVLEEIIEIKLQKFRYFGLFWNYIDLMIIVSSMYTLTYSVIRQVYIEPQIDQISFISDAYVSFGRYAFWQIEYNNLMAIFVFLIWIKLFKFVGFNLSMLQFSMTLSRCSKDLLGFGFMFLIVFLSFGLLGYMLFGAENLDFSTFKNSMFTLMRTILGDFDFLALEKTNRILGPIYFVLFIFFVFFVLLVGIVLKY